MLTQNVLDKYMSSAYHCLLIFRLVDAYQGSIWGLPTKRGDQNRLVTQFSVPKMPKLLKCGPHSDENWLFCHGRAVP